MKEQYFTGKIISKVLDVDRKCGCCNNHTSTFYSEEGFEGRNWEQAICGDCFLEMLIENNVKLGGIDGDSE